MGANGSATASYQFQRGTGEGDGRSDSTTDIFLGVLDVKKPECRDGTPVFLIQRGQPFLLMPDGHAIHSHQISLFPFGHVREHPFNSVIV